MNDMVVVLTIDGIDVYPELTCTICIGSPLIRRVY